MILTLDREVWPLTSPDRAREDRLDQDQSIRSQDRPHWPIRGQYRGHVSVWVTVMGLIEPFNQSKEWTVTRILGLCHTAWLCLIAAPRHKLSLSVSRQLFQTGWRRRDSSLGEVARQINSKYKYLVLIVKEQCNVRIKYIHIEKNVFVSKYFCLELSHIGWKKIMLFQRQKAISITKFSKPLNALNVTFESYKDIIEDQNCSSSLTFKKWKQFWWCLSIIFMMMEEVWRDRGQRRLQHSGCGTDWRHGQVTITAGTMQQHQAPCQN